MKKKQKIRAVSTILISMSILVLSPLLSAFAQHPVAQIPVAPFWLVNFLVKVGKWMIANFPFIIDGGQWLVSLVVPDCPPGIITTDPSTPLNAVYSGCIECTMNGVHYKINHVLMNRPTINDPFVFSSDFKNPCQ